MQQVNYAKLIEELKEEIALKQWTLAALIEKAQKEEDKTVFKEENVFEEINNIMKKNFEKIDSFICLLFPKQTRFHCVYTFSSCIAFLGYNKDNSELLVAFKDAFSNISGIYLYSNVQKNDFLDLLNTESIGKNVREFVLRKKYEKYSEEDISVVGKRI